MSGLEKRYCEVRAEGEGRRLSGVAVRYGDVALVPGIGRESFQRGAFGNLAEADVILTSHHERERPLARTGGGGLTLIDGADALEVRADLPDTSEAADTLTLVKSRVLRGFSVEFRALQESVQGGVRVIQSARLARIGVVDTGAYPQSTVEARAKGKGKRWASGALPSDTQAFCECLSGECDSILVQPGAYTMGADTLALVGRATEAIGSTEAGTLTFRQTEKAMKWSVTDAAKNTAAGQTLTDLAEAGVKVYGRPLLDEALSTFSETGRLRTFSRAWIRALLLKPILNDAARLGWEPIQFFGTPEPRRRALWL